MLKRHLKYFIGITTLFLVITGLFSVVADDFIPVRLKTIITGDDQGDSIVFPQYLFFDRRKKETYLVGSTQRITVYDQQFFPVASFGKGRGVDNPRGLAVDSIGRIYLCQGTKSREITPRLTIFNAAFFIEKEIIFSQLSGFESFYPTRVAIGSNGNIYLTGDLALPGVMVLDNEGRFLRWIQIVDRLFRANAEKAKSDSEHYVVSNWAEKGRREDRRTGRGDSTGRKTHTRHDGLRRYPQP